MTPDLIFLVASAIIVAALFYVALCDYLSAERIRKEKEARVLKAMEEWAQNDCEETREKLRKEMEGPL